MIQVPYKESFCRCLLSFSGSAKGEIDFLSRIKYAIFWYANVFLNFIRMISGSGKDEIAFLGWIKHTIFWYAHILDN